MKQEILSGGIFMAKGEVGFIVTDEYMAWIEDVKKE